MTAPVMHRAHPCTSGPHCQAYDNQPHPATLRCTFIDADVTCPDCARAAADIAPKAAR